MRWKVPRIWEGGDCWILGGGASLTTQFDIPDDIVEKVRSGKLTPAAYSEYMSAIHDKHVIGVNSAFLIGNWIDICFFGDRHWYFDNLAELEKFDGLIVTCSPFTLKDEWKHLNVKYLSRDRVGDGISSNPSTVCWNANSGAAAISLAANAGCKRIILVGFDMKLNAKNQGHWHNLYKVVGKQMVPYQTPFYRFLSGFRQIAIDAKVRKIQILNASPDSEITEFKKVTVKDILNGSV